MTQHLAPVGANRIAMVLACIAALVVIPAAVALLLVIWRDLQG